MPELNFDSEKVEPVGSFTPLPVGDYLVIISASERKPTKNGKGEYLQLTYDVIDGEYKGRKLFDRLNIINENETAQNIAKGTLSAICHVTGVAKPKVSEELHNIPIMVHVVITPAKGEYSEGNVIKEYKYKDGRKIKDAAKPTPAKAKVENAATSDGKKQMPWDNK